MRPCVDAVVTHGDACGGLQWGTNPMDKDQELELKLAVGMYHDQATRQRKVSNYAHLAFGSIEGIAMCSCRFAIEL